MGAPGHWDTGHLDTGTPGHRGTGGTGTPGHRGTGTPRHQDTRTPGYRDTGPPGQRDTGAPGHWGVHRCPSVPVSHCPGLPVPRCPGVPVPWCPGAPVPRRIAASGLASCVTRGGGGVADLKTARAIRAPQASPRLSRITGVSLRQGLRHASQGEGGWQISRPPARFGRPGHPPDSAVSQAYRCVRACVMRHKGGGRSQGFGGTPRTPLFAPPRLPCQPQAWG